MTAEGERVKEAIEWAKQCYCDSNGNSTHTHMQTFVKTAMEFDRMKRALEVATDAIHSCGNGCTTYHGCDNHKILQSALAEISKIMGEK